MQHLFLALAFGWVFASQVWAADPVQTTRAETYFQTGQIFAGKELYADAIAAYQKSIEADPKFEKAYISLAIVYSLQKKYPEAIQVLEKALKIKPNAYLSYKVLGKIYQDLKKPGEAIIAFENYLKYIPPAKLKSEEKQEIQALLYQLNQEQDRLKKEAP